MRISKEPEERKQEILETSQERDLLLNKYLLRLQYRHALLENVDLIL